MTLSSEIIGVQTLKAGERVATAVAILRAMNSESALSPQVRRRLSAPRAYRYPCFSGRRRTMTVGTVSMDMLAVDLTPCRKRVLVRQLSCGARRSKLMSRRRCRNGRL